jgi:hypothetical protein
MVFGVPNRFFGCHQEGTIKEQGIETEEGMISAYFSRF